MKNDTLPNGEAVREFYLSLSTIQEYYYEKGYKKKAYLYRTLKEKLGWKMSIESFRYHFRKAFNEVSSTSISPSSALNKLEGKPKEDLEAALKGEPKVAIIDTSSTSIKIKKNTRAVRESI